VGLSRGPRARIGAATTARRRLVAAGDAAARDVAQRLREILGVLFGESGGGSPGIRAVADRMGTSVRTLQRRLRAKGLTYATVVGQARANAARQMLKDLERTIGDVARALGYSDHAHFTRAFQRWTGVTPRDFRRRGRAGTDGGAHAPSRDD